MINFDKDELRISVVKTQAPTASPGTAITAPDSGKTEAVVKHNILELSSLRGYATELEQEMRVQQPFLGQMALTGEATIWYAAPNTGKTLLAIHLMIEAVERGEVNPSNIFYIAADDSANGLIEKLHILEEYGVHVLAPGHRGFETSRFVNTISKMTADDAVNGICIVADTVKKFVSLMDKTEARKFGDTIRRFIMKGGTFVGLAHTNKNRGVNGKVVYSGTSDLIEDVDCAYLLDEMEQVDGRKTVAFENIKRRGNVASTVAYSYSIEEGQSFGTLLASVGMIGDEALSELYRQTEMRSDASVIAAIKRLIGEGVTSKMHLAKAVSASERLGRNRAVAIIERYTGDDPAAHLWNFQVGAHGKREYVLLTPAAA